MKAFTLALLLAASAPAFADGEAKNIIFFLGDGMGPTTITAARIFQHKEEGLLNFEKFDRVARVKTYSKNAMVTDSAPSMGAYMTGQKINNDGISIDAKAITPVKDKNGNSGQDACAPGGTIHPTMLELAKARGKAVGAITTTELAHATPASTYAHICHRSAYYAIAAQLVPGSATFNSALGDGVDVLMGGGRNHFTPWDAATNKAGRADGRNLLAELAERGYAVGATRADMYAARVGQKYIGLYAAKSHLEFESARAATEQPSLTEMTEKAIDLLAPRKEGFFLMVEGGRIDMGLHDSNARDAIEELVSFDKAIQAAVDKMEKLDPGLKHTLIVVTADHDHTIVFNGYAKRGNGILDIVRDYKTGEPAKDADGKTYTSIGFGTGPNRKNERADIDADKAQARGYKQESAIRLAGESHGGGDVKLFAVGAGSQRFKGTIENTKVFTLMRAAYGF